MHIGEILPQGSRDSLPAIRSWGPIGGPRSMLVGVARGWGHERVRGTPGRSRQGVSVNATRKGPASMRSDTKSMVLISTSGRGLPHV